MKVFVSSVIEGYRSQRESAKQAIESIGMIPVMAESFGARSTSPREACLDGVRGSDIYIGLFGNRYGTSTDSGKSVTEEEYDAAVARGMPCYCFIDECNEREAPQRGFIDRVTSYNDGKFVVFFRDLQALVLGIIRALSPHLRSSPPDVEDSQLQSDLQAFIGVAHRDPQTPAICAAVRLLPSYERLGIERLQCLDFRDQVLSILRSQRSGVIGQHLGLRVVDGRNYLDFVASRDDRTLEIAMRLYVDGTTMWHVPVVSGKSRGQFDSMFGTYFISESAVSSAIRSIQSCSSAFVHSALRGTASTVAMTLSLVGGHGRYLNKLDNNPSSYNAPSGHVESPLTITERPIRVSWGATTTLESEHTPVMALLRQAFIAEGMYYKG